MTVNSEQEEWVTVHEFMYQHEILTIQSRLASEGIEFILQDELTAQIIPLYSNAIGAIKLLVHQSDVEQTRAILIEDGIIDPNLPKDTLPEERIYRWLVKIPFIRRYFERKERQRNH